MKSSNQCMLLSGALFFTVAALFGAQGGPVAVSPGASGAFVEVADRCPTFSWSPIRAARFYELLVYEVDESFQRAEPIEPHAVDPVLAVRLPGAALSWTPPAAQCLERGREYTWFVRARGKRFRGPWSEPRLFALAARPSAEEVQEALETLREFLDLDPTTREESIGRLPTEKPRTTSPTRISASTAPQRETTDRQVNALPPTETWAFQADVDSDSLSAYGVWGISRASIESSTGVLGEAISPTGLTYGVTGQNWSTTGAGVRGMAWGASGTTAGVYGFAISPDGYAGFFESNRLGTGGVYARAATNSDSDLVLGGTSFTDDDGTIFSDPDYANSDLFLYTNDALFVQLDHDQAGSDPSADFVIRHGSSILFEVNETGNTQVHGNLTVSGTPGGNLVDQADISAAILSHEETFHPLRVFVSSSSYEGNLGGLSGADAKCQALAISAGLPGIFKAWLSIDAGREARDRLTQPNRPYYLPNGTKVADNWSDLTSCSGSCLDHAIDKDEWGNTPGGSVYVWTKTDTDGSEVPSSSPTNAQSCSGWTTNSSGVGGWRGRWDRGDADWTNASSVGNWACNNPTHLYCFQQ